MNKNILIVLVALTLGCGSTVEPLDTGRTDSHTTDTNVPETTVGDSGSPDSAMPDTGTDTAEDTGMLDPDTGMIPPEDTGVATEDTGVADTATDSGPFDPCTLSIWPPGSFLCPGHGSGGYRNPDCVNITVNNDALNCGACGHSCNGPGYDRATCVRGVCNCWYIGDTRALCNNTCVDMQLDDNNCRRCGNRCPSGVHCSISLCNGI